MTVPEIDRVMRRCAHWDRDRQFVFLSGVMHACPAFITAPATQKWIAENASEISAWAHGGKVTSYQEPKASYSKGSWFIAGLCVGAGVSMSLTYYLTFIW